MEIGLLKERKRDERRVGLRPDQAAELTEAGHSVYVETGAGKAVGYEDAAYEAAGAEVVSQADVYERAGLLVKVKCPLPEEYGFLRSDHVLFTYLHFDENIAPARLMQIVETGVTGIAYEWVEVDGRFPLLWPMSELTGAVCAKDDEPSHGRSGHSGWEVYVGVAGQPVDGCRRGPYRRQRH